MNKKIKFLILAFVLTASGEAYAANKMPKTMTAADPASTPTQVSEAERPEVKEPVNMRNQRFSLGPQLGVVNYRDNTGSKTTRGTIGVGLDWNMANLFFEEPSDFYIGIQSGVFVSKVGDGSANFFGGSSPAGSNFGDATLLTIPADAKFGYNISDKTRASLHGGGNVIYRSSAGAVSLGKGGPEAGAVSWKVYPNVGADFEVQVSKPLSILARPDFTITPGDSLFMGTLAANFIF